MNLFSHVGERKYSFVSLMNFVDFTVFNSTAAEFTNINAGGVDVPPASSVTATLTGAELLVVCALDGAAVMQNAPTATEKAAVAVLIGQATSLEDAINSLQDATNRDNSLHKAAAHAALDALGF